MITAEITGGSPFGGAGVSLSYETYFGEDSLSASKQMQSIRNNKYIATFRGSNGTEIWCLIKSGNTVLGEHTIQIGHIEGSNKTSLAITHITQTPEKPTSTVNSITITVNVTSNATVTNVILMEEIISPSGYSSSSSSSMQKINNHTYSEIIPLGSGDINAVSSGEYLRHFESGTKIYCRIAAKDKSGNTAAISKIITIE